MLAADLLDAQWTRLLKWLSSHGFDSSNICVEPRQKQGAGNGLFATTTIQPGSHLFTVPSSALINHKTLQDVYPIDVTTTALSAFQMISLHLWLWRPNRHEESKDTLFGPYISVLPKDFAGHPLSWKIKHDIGHETQRCQQLLAALPSPVAFSLSNVTARFYEDWKAVENYATSRNLHPCIVSNSPVLDFLWAWLNVNTRCVYHRLEDSSSSIDNLTLCPVLDFLNHTPFSQASVQVASKASKGIQHMALSSPDTVINTGDELFLKYGQRSNTDLFAEYGFVNEVDHASNCPIPAEVALDVEIQSVLEPLIQKLGSQCQTMKDTLKDHGYEGDYSIHLRPSPAHPSYRAITCLRLYCLFEEHTRPDTQTINLWTDTLNGRRPCISEHNEKAWRATLQDLCSALVVESESLRDNSEAYLAQSQVEWEDWAWRCIRGLNVEVGLVAEAVIASVQAGEDF